MNEIQKCRAVVLIDLAVRIVLWALTYVLDRLGLINELYGYVGYTLVGLTVLSLCDTMICCSHCKSVSLSTGLLR